jgi:thiamine kinase-like enzyme
MEEEELERRVKREGGNHKRIIVVDFEYAGANPRGFDIGQFSLLALLFDVLIRVV